MPPHPSMASVLWYWVWTSRATAGNSRPRTRSTPKMRMAWVMRKSTNTGASTDTDSFTPRRFRTMSSAMAANSIPSFQGCQAGGRKLKVASAPAATEVEMVST